MVKENKFVSNKYFCSSNFIIQFDFNSDELDNKGMETINKFVDYLINNNYSDVKVTGFADSQGNADYNLNLSRSRASNVADIIEQSGIRNVFPDGKGEEKLITDKYGREIKDQSRRVEFCWK